MKYFWIVFWLTSSNSLRVSSSMRRMSSIFRSIHLSIQQNSWRWKLVNKRFSCCKATKVEKGKIWTLPSCLTPLITRGSSQHYSKWHLKLVSATPYILYTCTSKHLKHNPGKKIRNFPAWPMSCFMSKNPHLSVASPAYTDPEVTNWFHRPWTNLLNEVLHFILQTPPLEFDSDQFVGTHVWAVFLGEKLLLQVQKYSQWELWNYY